MRITTDLRLRGSKYSNFNLFNTTDELSLLRVTVRIDSIMNHKAGVTE